MTIAILGYGIEGESAYRYFKQLRPEARFVIYDESDTPKIVAPDGVEVRSGPDIFSAKIDADIVVRSPAIHPDRIHSDGRITSVTQEFFAVCPAPIIGVTGTKGKGTTASLIQAILAASGRMSWLVGNIGTPSLDIIDQISAEDIVVYELSSFQLWDVERSPHVAVVLMIEPDHLDVHTSFEEYVGAKARIVAYQEEADKVVYTSDNKTAASVAATSRGEQIPVPSKDGIHVVNGIFYDNEQEICSTSHLKIPGNHNIHNAMVAIAATREYVADSEAIARGLAAFVGLPHRIEHVRTIDNVMYYNDSYSSATPATVAAIKSFEAPKILILGGYSRGIDFNDLAEEISKNNVKRVLLIGQTKHEIASALQKHNFKEYDVLENTNMKGIVAIAKSKAESGDIVMLSPGCPSFDMFKNFSERGEQFRQAINSL